MGIGPKPQSCPNWVPDEPDGDDSDDTLGPMDEYGHLFNLVDYISDTIYINTDTTWNNRKYLYRHVVIQNGATLTVSNEVTFYKTAELILRGGKIIIDGGKLTHAVIKNEENSNSQIEIRHNGNIQVREEDIFSIPLGNKLIMEYGKIHRKW